MDKPAIRGWVDQFRLEKVIIVGIFKGWRDEDIVGKRIMQSEIYD